MKKRLFSMCAVLLGSASLLFGQDAEAPAELSWYNYEEVRDYVVGQESDNNFLLVDWKDNVLDGQVAAVEEDKPLLLWLYFGGPLGAC